MDGLNGSAGRAVRILGIETSCDETAAAVVVDGALLLSNVVLSQIPVHQLYGGVVPELASREHLRGIVPVVRQALETAQLTLADLDAIAVTEGPGLVGALLVGLTYAKSLTWMLNCPLIAVNHLEGHIHAVLLEERRNGRPDPPLPAVVLVVSGGHTHLYRVERAEDGRRYRYTTLGQTRDDAAGEAYDKVAKLLALGYPGGPILDQLAAFGRPDAVPFTRPRIKGRPGDFSFSGIKTAVLRYVQTHDMAAGIAERRAALAVLPKPTLDDRRRTCDATTLDLIASFQHAVVGDLTEKALAAAEAGAAASLWVTGGVAANRQLRQTLGAAAHRVGLPLFIPAPVLCTDNAAMIATAAFPYFQVRQFAACDIEAYAQWPLDAIGAARSQWKVESGKG